MLQKSEKLFLLLMICKKCKFSAQMQNTTNANFLNAKQLIRPIPSFSSKLSPTFYENGSLSKLQNVF